MSTKLTFGDFLKEFPMKAVMPSVPPEILDWRKKTGADRWDEKWGGVLHLVPMPTLDHQDFEGSLETYLRNHWVRKRRAKIYHNINIAPPGGWPNDYRIPDLALLLPGCKAVNREKYLEGPPDVAVEIRSPEDESYEKLDFYAQLGVAEVFVIDRDTKVPEIFFLTGNHYQKKHPDADGWLRSDLSGIEMRVMNPGKLTPIGLTRIEPGLLI